MGSKEIEQMAVIGELTVAPLLWSWQRHFAEVVQRSVLT
jgi:hypothetical protein